MNSHRFQRPRLDTGPGRGGWPWGLAMLTMRAPGVAAILGLPRDLESPAQQERS
jgi:hypothetical protein